MTDERKARPSRATAAETAAELREAFSILTSIQAGDEPERFALGTVERAIARAVIYLDEEAPE